MATKAEANRAKMLAEEQERLAHTQEARRLADQHGVPVDHIRRSQHHTISKYGGNVSLTRHQWQWEIRRGNMWEALPVIPQGSGAAALARGFEG